ncbi:MAG: hypothetical protein EOO62_40450 [Hymenobacter sp.]|nr:MAG: hypothetical protein EOO62_40450 [Hymenobacter sp.]
MKLLSTAACLLFSATAFAQDIRSYVQANTARVAPPDATSDDYADLAAVGQAIGEARVVMLGEQDHGDGPAFQAKTRLVKYLHERKGFAVLAFESDFYGLTTGWDQLAKQPDSIRHFLQQNIFLNWSNSADCRSTTRCQADVSPAAYQAFLEAVQGLVGQQLKPAAYRPDMRQTLASGLQLISQAQLAAGDTSAWQRVVASLRAYSVPDRVAAEKARDKAMADNLTFLLTHQYQNAKVIVWAANQHIMKYSDQLPSQSKASRDQSFDLIMRDKMGTYFVQDPQWARQTYVLGFASYQGTAGRLDTAPYTYPVQAPDKNGLETWVPASIAYGFLDFTPYNKQFNYPATPFLLKSPSHYTVPARVAPIPWNLVYDGLFFIRDTRATTKSE